MNTQSLVNWTYALADANGYSLERSMNLGSVWSEVLSCSAAITTYYDNNLTWHDHPWYRVSALNPYGIGPKSLTAKLFINSPGIDTPQLTGSQGFPHATQSLLNWNYTGSVNPGATDSFTLERSADSGSSWITFWNIDPTGSAFIDDPVAIGSSYWYRIVPHCDFGLYGPYSNIVAVFLAPWPAVPVPTLTAFQFPSYTPSSSVSWSNTGPITDLNGFVLERAWRRDPSQAYTFSNYVTYSGLGTTNFQDTAVTWSREYSYKMYAYSGSAPEIRRSTETAATTSFIQAPQPRIWAWQNGTTPQVLAFWGNYLGQFSMSLSRSSNGGATWDVQTMISPLTGGFYYTDDAVSVGQTYQYKVREIYQRNQLESNVASVTVKAYDPSRLAVAYAGDAGFQYGSPTTETVWERHTASLLDANDAARGQYQIRKWLLGGDNGYVGNDFRGGFEGQIGRTIGPSSSFLAVLGNHEISDMGLTNYRNYFYPPSSSYLAGPVTYRFYTSSLDNVMFFMLETTWDTDNKLDVGQYEYLWFSSSIAHSQTLPNIVWRVAVVHVPAVVSQGSHPPNPYLAAIPWNQWGIDVLCSGHVHWVERLESASCVFHINSIMGSDKRQPGPISPYTKWWYTDYAGAGDFDDYIWSLFEFASGSNKYEFSMSFYSGSVKVPDTGSTEMINGIMTGGSLVLMKPWYNAPTASASQVGFNTQAYVSWTFDGDFSQSLYRSVDSGSTWPVTYSIDPGVRNYTDSTVAADTSYWWKVRETRWPTEPFSNVAEVFIVGAVPPLAVPKLTASVQL